jgi:hypothetical protein
MANENFYSSSSLARNAPTNEEISARAYELWQQQGCPHGRAEANWFEAERELIGLSTASNDWHTQQSTAKPTKIINSKKKEGVVSPRGVPLKEEVSRSDPDSPFDDLSEEAPLTTKVERDIADFGDSKTRRSPTSA